MMLGSKLLHARALLDLANRGMVTSIYRCMVLLAGCTGLRISEVMGLPWTGINFESLAMEIREGYVRSQVTKLNWECSEDELPLDPDVAAILLEWNRLSPRDNRRLGLQPQGRTDPTILARCGRRYSKLRHYGPSFRDKSAGTRCVSATAVFRSRSQESVLGPVARSSSP